MTDGRFILEILAFLMLKNTKISSKDFFKNIYLYSYILIFLSIKYINFNFDKHMSFKKYYF